MTCIIDCMGGGFDHLTRLVGADYHVEKFTPMGIAIVSLKYRLKPVSKNIDQDTLADGKRAVRLVRARAKEWGINPNRIGIMGASAGGNLSLNTSTHFDLGDKDAKDPIERISSRPDFAGLISSFGSHEFSYYTPSKDAGVKAPPAFICSAEDDHVAPYTFSKSIEKAWKEAGIEVAFFGVSTGGHGAFTLDSPGEGAKWPEKFLPWLEKINKLNSAGATSNFR